MKQAMFALVLALATGLAATASGQEAPQSDADRTPPVILDDILVEGRPFEAMVRDFVDEVGAPTRGRGLARWSGPICVGVLNMQPDAAQAMIDRISRVALDVGLDVGEPGCDPNVIVVTTTDGAALATQLVQARRRVFDAGSLQIDRGAASLRAFQTSDRPVRWWQLSIPTNRDTGERAIRLAGDVDLAGNPTAPKIDVFAFSKIQSQIRDDLFQSLIIIDVPRIGDASFEQLSDYVTMMALAQIDAAGDTSGFSTILNLFDDPAAPAGLTSWDRTYLEVLYSNRLDRLNPGQQARTIVRTLTEARRNAAAQQDD